MPQYKIPHEEIKCICQQCRSTVKFREQCFLCGEMNWSDETLDRLEQLRTVEWDTKFMVTYVVSTKEITFGVYPVAMRWM